MAGIRQTGALSLPGLRERIKGLASPAFKANLAQLLAAEGKTQVQQGFRGERDPYGLGWKPLQRRRGKILQDTGRMRASVAAEPAANGFRIDIATSYAKFHQHGTKPHARAARAARQNKRGRFVSAKAKTAFLLRIKAHTNPGVPVRQMIPDAATGGLGPIWSTAFDKVTSRAIDRTLKGRP